MHRLSFLHIENFRACQNVSFSLDSYTALVGQNNTGKSTILDAIRWVVSQNTLSVTDFSDSQKPVIVAARISGITEDLLAKITVSSHQISIKPYCENGFLWIRRVASGGTKKDLTEQVYEPHSYRGDEVPTDWRPYPTGLPQAVSALFLEPLHIKAMDDVPEDVGKAKSGTTMKLLLDEIMGSVLESHEELNNALGTIKSVLAADGKNRSPTLKDFDSAATNSLCEFFPGLSLELDLQCLDIKEFFKAGDLNVRDALTGDRRRFDLLGTGAQRAIQMALIRHLAQKKTSEGGSTGRRLLLIDEPELYLHPQGVRRLRQALRALSTVGYQVIFSTHSPIMIDRDSAADTVIVRKDVNSGTTVSKPLREAVKEALDGAQAQARTLFELGNVSEIYFSNLVILCEGKTDCRLLPQAYEKINGQALEQDHMSVVSLGSCSDIPKALSVLKAMGIKACAVADLDFAFTEARKGVHPLLEKDGSDLNQAKEILLELQKSHSFKLNANGLPQNEGNMRAAEVWRLFAQDSNGRLIVNQVHASLKHHRIWVWPSGTIEDVTGSQGKGEDAILEQETQIRNMSSEKIRHSMPDFVEVFEWIKSL